MTSLLNGITKPLTSSLATPSSSSAFETFVSKNSIKFIRIQWNDLSNLTRFRVVPLAFFRKLLALDRPGVAIIQACLGLVQVQLAEGFDPTGEYLYVIDMGSLMCCGYAEGHASVMGFFQAKAPAPGATELGSVMCPRTMLLRVVEEAKRTSGVTFRLGFETEFILLKNTSPITVANAYGWSESSSLSTGSPEAAALEEMALALQKAGVELEMYHSEGAPGQYELVCTHYEPMEAVDKLVLTRETMRNVAHKYGFRATLAPRLQMDSCGSAAHMHFSLSQDEDHGGAETTASAGMKHAPHVTKLEASFLAGLLAHLPGICALSLPSDASYTRMVDGAWTGGTYVGWGLENREVPIRLSGIPPSRHHFELRCLDGTANPYVAVAAILGSGMIGVKDRKTLEVMGTGVPPAGISEVERGKLGIKGRLPANRAEAGKVLKGDKELTALLGGEEFVNKFLAVQDLVGKVLKDDNGETSMKKVVEFY